jgi:hypothetical protein
MVRRALVLLATGIAVLPKCPLGVMVILGALGLGHSLHETVFAILQGVAVVGVLSLIVVRRRRAPAQIVFGVAAACAVLTSVAGVGRPLLGYAGALLLALVWLVKLPGDTAPSCACAESTMTSEV